LNGQPFEPRLLHLDGTPVQPAPGDLVEVAGALMVLGTEKKQAYHVLSPEDGVVWAEGPGGRRSPAAVRVSWHYTNEKDAGGGYKRELINPLQKLGPKEIHEIRGAELDAWSDDLPGALKHLDPQRVCVLLTGDAAAGPGRCFPPLPAKLRYVAVQETNN